MERDYIGFLISLCISFYLNSIESLEERDITAITCLDWTIYILFAEGSLKWHLS